MNSFLFLCFGLLTHLSLAQQNETPLAGFPYNPHPNQVVVTEVKHFDNMCWKIATANGTFYYENGKNSGKIGFSSAFDKVGNDWIGNDADRGYNTSPKGTSKHEYRGWPNFGNNNFDHPQRSSGGQTRWVDTDGNTVAFNGRLEGDHLILRSFNSVYELEYHFFATHAAIKVIKALDKYAFLYEGPVGGEQDANDKWVFKNGTENQKLCSNTSCASPYIYFVDSDPRDTQVWYMGTANLTSGMGGESYIIANNMVVVSYGRFGNYPNDKRALTGTNAICVFGFFDKAAHSVIDEFISARLQSPYTSETPGASSSSTLLSSSSVVLRTPYSSMATIPGVVEAENYDVGGEEITYHDTDPTNQGSTYRSDGVDISGNATIGYAVGWTQAGEWMEYTVQVTTAGTYNWEAVVSSNADGKKIHMLLDGTTDLTGSITIPNTGGWDTYGTIAGTTPALTAGTHVLRIAIDDSYVNIDKVLFNEAAVGILPGIVSANTGNGVRQYPVYNVMGARMNKYTMPGTSRSEGPRIFNVTRDQP